MGGKDIATLHESDLAQIRGKTAGFIFQQFNLMPQLSALRNVSLPMLFQGWSPEEQQRKSTEILTMLGLGDRLDHKPGELSGGQRQRVAIARALVNDPDFLLADEPTGNLDTKTGAEILSVFQKLHKEGKTVIMVTHDTSLVKFAERIITINDGEIKEVKN